MLEIGWAQVDITPNKPSLMEGQMYQRYSRYVHDPLTATALAIRMEKEQAVLVSLDMTEIPTHCMALLRSRLEAYGQGLCFDNISINATHTHNSSSFYNDFMRTNNEQVFDKSILPPLQMIDSPFEGEEARVFLVEKLFILITDAWDALEPGGISFAHEYAAVAFNRRPRFRCGDGSVSVMYGDCSDVNFLGFESGGDNAVELLYTWNARNELTGVAVNVPCPSQVYELHSFLSADYWGPARNGIRERLGKNVYVLPLCGAAGDLAPVDLVSLSKDNREELRLWNQQAQEVFRNFDMTLLCGSIGDRITEAVARGYRWACNYIDRHPIFRHIVIDIELPLRKVTEGEYRAAVEDIEAIQARFSADNPMGMDDLTRAFEPQGVVIRYRQQRLSDTFQFRSHIIRLGDAVLATNPFELFSEYAQRIKARSAARQAFIVQLANGVGGYLPTVQAIEGGSYSSKPASTCCGPEGGDQLVELTLDAIEKLWK